VHSYFHLELKKAVKSPPKDKVCFQKCGVFYYAESSFSNDDSERLEYHFEKWSEVFVPNTSEINNVPQFSYRCHRFGESNPSPSLNFRISKFLPLTHVFERQIWGKMETNLKKLREVFGQKKQMNKNLFHFIHNYHDSRDTEP
jgi:hypothetical protein